MHLNTFSELGSLDTITAEKQYLHGIEAILRLINFLQR